MTKSLCKVRRAEIFKKYKTRECILAYQWTKTNRICIEHFLLLISILGTPRNLDGKGQHMQKVFCIPTLSRVKTPKYKCNAVILLFLEQFLGT